MHLMKDRNKLRPPYLRRNPRLLKIINTSVPIFISFLFLIIIIFFQKLVTHETQLIFSSLQIHFFLWCLLSWVCFVSSWIFHFKVFFNPSLVLASNCEGWDFFLLTSTFSYNKTKWTYYQRTKIHFWRIAFFLKFTFYLNWYSCVCFCNWSWILFCNWYLLLMRSTYYFWDISPQYGLLYSYWY